MNATTHRGPEPAIPSEQETKLARESSRLIAAGIGRNKTARLRMIDGKQDLFVPVSVLRLLVDIPGLA